MSTPTSKTILCIDDDNINLLVLKHLVHYMGYSTESASSGLGIYLCKELAKRNAWELSHAYQNGQSTISLRIKT